MNPISNEMIAELEALLGGNKVLKGDAIGADFAHDELPGGKFCAPALVCEAASTEDVAAVLTVCNRETVPVTVRGAGTGLVGGSVPVCGGVVLSLAKMNAILELDSEKKTARVQPGVLLETLKAEAAAKGLYYPPDPGEKTATIGGNAATNAGGPSAVKYGVTRDYVRGATVVLPTGEVLQLGGATGKDNSGYRLLPLVLGSEGTLGVITELTLRLVEKPKADVSLILPFLDGESCVNAALRILQEGMEPAALEYMDTDLVEFAGKATGNPVFPVEMDGERVGASLLLTLEGKDDDELDSKMEAVAELAEELECLDILVVDTPTLKRDVWGAHDAFHTAVEGAAKSADELNMAVPAAEMAGYVEYLKEIGEEKGVGVYAYGHVGDGGLHAYFCSDQSRDAFEPVMAELAELAYAKCRAVGGAVSSEHGIGYAKKAFLRASAGEAGYALMGRIKRAFDPKGILNPGKVV